MNSPSIERASRSSGARWRAIGTLLALAALITAILWMAPVRTSADDLEALPPTSAVEAHSKPAEAAAGEAALHAGAQLDRLSPEPDLSPAAIANYDH